MVYIRKNSNELSGRPNSLVAPDLQGGQAMGRGRAKAKQAKVARQLKYHAPEMDFDSLQRELSGASQRNDHRYSDHDDDDGDDYSDKY